MKNVLFLTAVLGLFAAGCQFQDENPDWAPQADYPSWTYDAPFYYRPSEDLPVGEVLNGIPVYHTRSEYFFIEHPAGYQVPGVPRLGAWYSINRGDTWNKGGFFGVEQSHFLFKGEMDGQHWIRFVGPQQGTSTVPPGMPHRIYVVDRQPPRIAMTVTPDCWVDEERTKPRMFKVGQNVILRWEIRDANLDGDSTKLEMCHARFPHNKPWMALPGKPRWSGSMTVELPAGAATNGGIRFRMLAKDKAGNVGIGMTDILHLPAAKGRVRTVRTKPADPKGLIQQTDGTPGPQLGWPDRGSLIRGGIDRVLGWMPDNTGGYDRLDLQFSADDSRSWQVLVADLHAAPSNRWFVPAINSKNCRIRIVGIKIDATDKSEKRFRLVESPRFTISTAVCVGAEQAGPKELVVEQAVPEEEEK